MTKAKITSEDIFNRIREIEEDLLHIPITDHFLDITQEKGRLLSVYASLRIAEALEQNSTGTHNNPDLPVVTTEKISGEKESRPSSLSAYSGNPSPLPGEKHRKNWEEILHEGKPLFSTEQILNKPFGSKIEGLKGDPEEVPSPEKFSGERETLKKFDIDKINKVSHLLRDRFLLSGPKKKSEEEKKKLDTINSYLKSYGIDPVEKYPDVFFTVGNELSSEECQLVSLFFHHLINPSESEFFEQIIPSFGLTVAKEKIGEEEIENLAYLPEEKAEQ